jgi:uncharacterized protein YndB with AHSA1/START domain
MAWFMVFCVSILLPQLKIGWLIKLISLFATLVVITKYHDIFLRYPFKKTFTAQRIIDAPVEVVWEQVRPQGRNNPYSAFHSSIRKVGENVFRYHTTNSKISGENSFDVKVTDEVPYQSLELKFTHKDSPEDYIKTSLGIFYKFEVLNQNQTKVIVAEAHDKPSILTFYGCEFMGAYRDDLRQLANVCEGQPNISWASAQIAMEELAFHPDATLGDTLRPIGDGILITITALVTALTIMSIWVV